jgi:hypothetical protein
MDIIHTATWYVQTEPDAMLTTTPTMQKKQYTNDHHAKFGYVRSMASSIDATNAISQAIYHPGQHLLPDVLAFRILLTMAIEHVASAKGSPTKFAILNLLLLRMLRLLPATSIFRGYVSMMLRVLL